MPGPLSIEPCRNPRPSRRLVGDLTLPAARVHEFCGPSRHALALIAAGRTGGPVFWIAGHWQSEQLHADGVQRYMNPGRIVFVRPKRPENILWCMEECLRAGCAPVTVAELSAPPALTPVRRLNIAAGSTAGQGKGVIGLLLIPGNGGAPGVETRWHLSPRHRLDTDRWILQRRHARMGPPAAWHLDWPEEKPAPSVVPRPVPDPVLPASMSRSNELSPCTAA